MRSQTWQVSNETLDHAPTLGTIKAPVLPIRGTRDRHVRPCSTEIMQDLIEAGGGTTQRIVLDGIGHTPFLENPARFDSELKAFISGL